jgi:hypothetical protein
MRILGITGQKVLPSSYESIASATVSSNQTTITFSSIPSTYKHLQIRALNKTTNTASAPQYIYMKLNQDSTAANYAWHQLEGNGSAASATAGTNNGQCYFANGALSSSATFANMFAALIIDIHDYTSTTKNKTIRAFMGINTNIASNNYRLSLESNLWINTAAVDRLDFTNDDQFAVGTVISLYGIKG